MAKIPQYDIEETITKDIPNPEGPKLKLAKELLSMTSGSISKKTKTERKQAKKRRD